MTLYSPLDLQSILMIDLAGTPEVFSFVAIVLFGIIASRFSLPNKVALPLFGLFAVIMAAYLPGLFVLVNIIAGLAIYASLTKIVK